MRNLVTGVTGQDGALIAKYLLDAGQDVLGLFRRSSSDNFWRLRELDILERLELVEADIDSYVALGELLKRVKIDRIFHLAGSSFTAESFRKPWQTFSTNTSAVFYLLEAVRIYAPEIHVVLAGSSEVFGEKETTKINLSRSANSFLRPTNPYGLSHLSNLHVAEFYRNMYDLRIAIPIMFNHESEFRGDQFLTKKLSAGAVALLQNPNKKILLGNLDAQKDWGSAREFMEFLFLTAETGFCGNYSIGTGELTSVRSIIQGVFEFLDISVEFTGEGINEKVIDRLTGKELISVDPRNLRPRETLPFTADLTDCVEIFGITPKHTVLDILPSIVEFDLRKRNK